MEIKHFKIETPAVPPPPEEDGRWLQAWHGLYRLAEGKSDKAKAAFKASQDAAHREGLLGERELEVDCFLSILEDMRRAGKRTATLLELGAGFGEWCLALAGVVRNRIVSGFDDCRAVGVEAEPTHYGWLCRHFQVNRIPGTAIRAVVSDRNGRCLFNRGSAADWYGQDRFAMWRPSSLSNLLRGGAEEVEKYALPRILDVAGIEEVDIVHMDVQGEEVRVVRGGLELAKRGVPGYWLIGTHRRGYNEQIREMLEKGYDCVLDIPPGGVGGGSNGTRARVQDGMMVFRRR